MGVVTGTFQYPNGSAVANGLYQWKLSSDAVDISTACIAPSLIVGSLDTNGNLTSTFLFNDVLSTTGGANTCYQLTVKAKGGAQVWNECYQLTGTAANLNTIPPSGAGGCTGTPITVTATSTAGAGSAALYRGWIYGQQNISLNVARGYNNQLIGFPYTNPIGVANPTATTAVGSPIYATPRGTLCTATALTLTASKLTIVANNSFKYNESVFLTAFTGAGTTVNGQVVSVTGPGSTSFTTALGLTAFTVTGQLGLCYPVDNIGGVLSAVHGWTVASNVLTLTATSAGTVPFYGTPMIMEKFPSGSLNGQMATVTYGGFGYQYQGGFTSSNDSASETGTLFADGALINVPLIGWSIASNVLYYDLLTEPGSLLSLGSITAEGLVHGSYLNGVSVNMTLTGGATTLANYTGATGGAVETGEGYPNLPYSSYVLGTGTEFFTSPNIATLTARVALMNTGSGRFWVGYGDATRFPVFNNFIESYYLSNIMATDTANFSYVGFRYSPTNASDANWKCVVNSAGTQTTVDSGVAADTKVHSFYIAPNTASASIVFSIDSAAVATISTNLPSSSLPMTDVIWVDNQNAVASYAAMMAQYVVWTTAV